jgi:uncharacterized protein YndB with AHSA1/START domain
MSLTKSEPTVVHNTFVLERHYPVAPERVFAALSDPARKQRWFAEGHGADSFEMDFRVGGAERATYPMGPNTPFPGAILASQAVYLDIVPGRRVVQASSMSMDDRIFSASLATFELVPNGDATDLVFTHQAAFFEGSDGPEMRHGGWQKLLSKLDAELGRE